MFNKDTTMCNESTVLFFYLKSRLCKSGKQTLIIAGIK